MIVSIYLSFQKASSPASWANSYIKIRAKLASSRSDSFLRASKYVKYLIAILLLSTQPVFAQNAESGKQGAIGIRYTRNAEGMIVVKYVEDKSPAAQAGIQVNDVMISIDGSSLRGMDPANIKNVLRGKVGSAVEIKLENSQTRAEYSASVVRRIVQFGAGDPLKYATKNNTQAEVKNDSKTAASPQLEAPKMSAKPSEKTPSPPAPITPSKTGAEQASATTTSASAASTTPSNSKYFIQTGAFFTKEIANDQVTSFNQKGYASFVDPAVINGSNVYRVRIGPLTTQQSVDALSKKLASQGITNSIIEAAPTTAKNWSRQHETHSPHQNNYRQRFSKPSQVLFFAFNIEINYADYLDFGSNLPLSKI